MPATTYASDSPLRAFGGLGAGFMMSEDQLGYLGYDGVAGRSWLTLGAALTPAVIVEGHGAISVFGSSGEDGGLLEAGGGLRLDLVTPIQRVHLSPAAHLNLGVTGDQVRPTVSLATAVLVDLSPAWSLGAMLQYGQVIQPDTEGNSSDARYFTFGMAMGFRPATAGPPQRHARARTARWPRRTAPNRAAARTPTPAAPIPPSEQLLVLIESVVAPLAESSRLVPPVLFEHDSVQYIPCGEAALYYVRDAIVRRRGPVLLEGHADTDGARAYNRDLALRRAQAVRSWLVDNGVEEARLRVRSRGESTTLAPDSDSARRQINRRVIVHFEEAP